MLLQQTISEMLWKNKTVISASFVSAGNISNAFLGFILLTAVAKELPLAQFGIYALLTNLLTLIAKFVDFGTNSLYVADNSTTTRSITGFITTKVILTALALVLSICVLFGLNIVSNDTKFVFFLGILAYSISYTLFAFYQKSQQYLEIVLTNTIPSLIKAAAGVGILFFNYSVNLHSAFSWFTLSIFGCLTVYVLMPPKEKVTFDYTQIDLQATLRTLVKAISPGTSQLIYESWQTLNNLLTKLYNTFADVGLFSMSNKIANIFSLISLSVLTVLLPKNTHRKSLNGTIHKHDFYETGVLAVGVFFLAICAILVAKIFLTLIFGNKFEESLLYLDILIFASAITAIQNFVENYFYVERKTDYLIKINLSKVILLVLVSVAFIPAFGLTTLAYANLLAALYGITVTILMIKKIEKLKLL